MITHVIRAVTLGVALTAAGCASTQSTQSTPAPVIVQPGAPGEASRVITAAQATDASGVRTIGADVQFMQGMIGHHAQALDMTALVASRTAREDMKLLARRIELSQADEIKMMQGWLTSRGLPAPDIHAHHAPGAPLMPGMLTAEEMTRLSNAKGAEFDRLFLEFMIKHHGGALVMVDTLFASAGAAQDTEVYGFASDVEADQRMEMDRMGALLNEMSRGSSR
jgi:uncharacterized protein (DUF305 family)